jgi:hypothetical protein
MSRLIIDFSRLRDTELDQKAHTILTEMANRALVFTNPIPALTVLETDLDEYRIAMVAAADRSIYAIEVKKQKRKALEATLRQLAWYVQQVAQGDRAVMLSSGYSVSKIGEPAGVLPKPTGFVVRSAEVGRVLMGVKRHRHASSYRFEYRKAGDSAWISLECTRSSVLIEGLESGSLYQFRAAYIGANPVRTFTNVLESYVL